MSTAAPAAVAKLLAKMLMDEAKYLYGVEAKVEDLHQELAWMQGFLQELDKRQQREELIRMWVSQVRDLAYDAEDIVEKYIYTASSSPKLKISVLPDIVSRVSTIASNPWSVHQVGAAIDTLTSKISKLNARLVSYGVKVTNVDDSTYNSRMRDLRQADSSSVEKDLIKRVMDTGNIVDKLLVVDGNNVAGIVGMGGLGKTLLAREVYHNIELRGEFNCFAWVYISQHPDKRVVLEEIYRALNGEAVDLRSLSEREVSEKVNQILIERKCLVVLDDIWDKKTWHLLKSAFGSIINQTSASKLLLTTRNEGVAAHVDIDTFISKPKPLSSEESWTLLRKKAFPRIDDDAKIDPKMKEIGAKMLTHCGGLPIAIVTLGGILATRSTVEEWEAVEKHIGVYLTKAAGQTDDIEEIGASQVLEMSYNDLPYYLKPCFLCLGNFPEGQEIPTDTLYQLWQAEGFVREPEENEVDDHVGFYEIAEQYLNELVKRCMVEVGRVYKNGRIETCKMHGFMRALCLSKSKADRFLEVYTMRGGGGEEEQGSRSSAKRQGQGCRRLVIPVGVEKQSAKLFDWMQEGAVKPRSMVLFRSDIRNVQDSPLSEMWFSKMSKALRLLRVLRLVHGAVMELPEELESCIHLRYLRMGFPERCRVSSVIWKLAYLQTLDLRESGRGVVIPNKLKLLKRLVHLYLPVFNYELEDDKELLQLGQPSEMETLVNCILETFNEDDLRKMKNLRVVSFKNKARAPRNDQQVMDVVMGVISFKTKARAPTKDQQVFDVMGAKTLQVVLKEMITSRLLTNPVSELKIDAKGVNEDCKILCSNPHAIIEKLTIHGVISEKMENILFPRTLHLLCLCKTEIQGDWISDLNIPELKVLKLLDNAVKGDKIVFSDKSFPKLTELELEWPDHASQVEGTLPDCCQLTIWCPKNYEERVQNAIQHLETSVARRPDIFQQG